MNVLLFIIGIFVFFVGAVCFALCIKGEYYGEAFLSFVLLALGVFIIVTGVSEGKNDISQPKPIEYPASEYELKLRIVEFEEQRDTTYILVHKPEYILKK